VSAVWKKLCSHSYRFNDFVKDECYEDAANKIVKPSEQLELEVNAAVVEELM
jgi:hypothetical protein